MSKEHHSLRFGICVQDSDHWTEEHRKQFGDTTSPELELWAVMEAAGNEYIRANPDLFCGELV